VVTPRLAAWATVVGLLAVGVASACDVGASDAASDLDSIPAGKKALRACASAQSGSLPRDWREESVSSGPLSLYAFQPLDSIRPESFEEASGRAGYYRPFKVVAIVRTGKAVTLVVLPHERDHVSLVYRKDSSGRTVARETMKVSEGDWAVTFNACRGDQSETEFGGGDSLWPDRVARSLTYSLLEPTRRESAFRSEPSAEPRG